MAEEYSVMIQNREDNAEVASVTGVVNGRQVAAVVLLRSLPKGKANQEKALANALVDAYCTMPKVSGGAAAITVSR